MPLHDLVSTLIQSSCLLPKKCATVSAFPKAAITKSTGNHKAPLPLANIPKSYFPGPGTAPGSCGDRLSLQSSFPPTICLVFLLCFTLSLPTSCSAGLFLLL